jgi:hypothetical protein
LEKLHLQEQPEQEQEQEQEQEREREQEGGLFHGVLQASTVEERHIVVGG